MKWFFANLFALLCWLPLFSQSTNVLERIIREHKADFGAWAQNPAKYEVQLIYTQIDRDAQNQPSFKSHTLGLDAKRYFYPASTVKMPTAFMALEKLNQLRIKGLTKYTPMKTGAARRPQTPVMTDASAPTLLPSLAHYIKKIFLVSDNDANNRLYEFLGQTALNEGLAAKGYHDTRIIHRLSVSGFDTEDNRHTNPVSFYNYDTLFYHQSEVYSTFAPTLNLYGEQKGRAYLNGKEQLVQAPFDFSGKNFVSLQNLHDILQAVMFPQAVEPARRFDFSEADYRFLYQCLSELPKESTYPNYKDKPDNYVKFWLFGDSTQTSIPSNIRIFNKVGFAYGFLIDVAYIVDFDSGVEFMMAGVIHVNANQTYNDGIYEYDKIGLPFFTQLGRAVYDYELKRPRKHRADLSRFMVTYD